MGDPVTTGMIIGAAGGALTSKNPIQGAMMGGALGAAGGGIGGSMMGASSGGGFTGGGFGSIGTAGQTAGGAGGLFGQGGTLSQVGQGLSLYNQAQQAFGNNQQPQPMQMAPAGQVQRGQPQPMDYMSLLNPQQQTVARPQPFSLL